MLQCYLRNYYSLGNYYYFPHAWEVSYNFEIGELSGTTLETGSVRLHADSMFARSALITNFFPVFLLLKEVIH